jgi:hypothetical protein
MEQMDEKKALTHFQQKGGFQLNSGPQFFLQTLMHFTVGPRPTPTLKSPKAT